MLSDDQIELLVRRSRAERFAPGFSARVLHRMRHAVDRPLGAVLVRYFIWVVPVTVTAIALLAIANLRASAGTRRGFDALLALPPVTLDAAYAIDDGTPSR